MGIPALWQHLRREGHEATLLKHFPSTPLPPNAFYRIDILASFYSTIRRIHTTSLDQNIINTLFEQHLISHGIPKTSFLYIDGPFPAEKSATRETRETKRTQALQKTQACIGDMEVRVGGRRRVRKPDFNKLFNNIRAAFYWSQESRISLVAYLINNGWNVIERPSEVDIAIASDCQPNDIVVSGDSDMLIYDTVLDHLEISRAKLTALGVVSKNDYTSNLTRLGVITNHKIVKSLEETETDVEKLVQQYLVHSDVVCKKPSATHFQASMKVFVHRQFTVPDSIMPPQTLGQGATAQGSVQQCRALKDILGRLEALRLRLRESKNR
ncbi:hypothetical protein BGZ47_004183 [Haplosporangium gracile]|nr:hypothetical protein BGZ47_004183 [Haplosporangium gracile]